MPVCLQQFSLIVFCRRDVFNWIPQLGLNSGQWLRSTPCCGSKDSEENTKWTFVRWPNKKQHRKWTWVVSANIKCRKHSHLHMLFVWFFCLQKCNFVYEYCWPNCVFFFYFCRRTHGLSLEKSLQNLQFSSLDIFCKYWQQWQTCWAPFRRVSVSWIIFCLMKLFRTNLYSSVKVHIIVWIAQK